MDSKYFYSASDIVNSFAESGIKYEQEVKMNYYFIECLLLYDHQFVLSVAIFTISSLGGFRGLMLYRNNYIIYGNICQREAKNDPMHLNGNWINHNSNTGFCNLKVCFLFYNQSLTDLFHDHGFSVRETMWFYSRNDLSHIVFEHQLYM